MATMTPAELLDDHQRRPRNLGKLAGASAIGDIGSIIVGDALRFYVVVDDGRIREAKFQVFNCQGQLAAASVVCEMAQGKTLAEAYAIDHAAVCDHLGGLDPMRLPPQLWGLEGLRTAIDAYEGRDGDFHRDQDPLLCRCHGVSEQAVRDSIALGGATTVEAVGVATKAGTGCGTCQADIRRWIERGGQAERAKGPAVGGKPVVGRIQTLHKISELIHAEFAGIEPWDIDGKIVRVRLAADLAENDREARAQLKALEARIRETIAPDLGVSAAP